MMGWNIFSKNKKHWSLPIVHCSLFILHCSFFIISCSPVRYIAVETHSPAALTFAPDMRRILIVNNAVEQQRVSFESDIREVPDSIRISADSTAIDFCRTLGETIAGFAGFDDVRLLEDAYRKDSQSLLAPLLLQDEIRQLCDEHEIDVVISLDRLLFTIKEHTGYTYFYNEFMVGGLIEVNMSGVLRVYLPSRVSPLSTIALSDSITPAAPLTILRKDSQVWEIIFTDDQTNLLRESAKYLAEEARIHFIPYWTEDIRWYYKSSDSRWKEAVAFATTEQWDKALNIWQKLYTHTSSWKPKARLASNIALGFELTGDLNEALNYAKLSHQLLRERLEEDDPALKRHEQYINVLSFRIMEEQRLRLQME